MNILRKMNIRACPCCGISDPYHLANDNTPFIRPMALFCRNQACAHVEFSWHPEELLWTALLENYIDDFANWWANWLSEQQRTAIICGVGIVCGVVAAVLTEI